MIRNLVLCLILVTIYHSGETFAAKWDYEHQEGWPKECFGGKMQSPVALSPDIAEGANFPPFQFYNYDEIYDATIKSNGHSAEIKIYGQKKPGVAGGGLNSNFVLDSMHFHWESEHVIEDRRFPLELHLVHYDNRTKDLSHALINNRVAVLAVLFYPSPDDDTELVPVFDKIKYLPTAKLNVEYPIRIELDDFIPRDRAGFYRYTGSLTTPRCTEGVTWTVFTNGLPISTSQLKLFPKLKTEEQKELKSNYRGLQELNDRKVWLKISDMDSAGVLIQGSHFVKLFLFCFVAFLAM